MAELNDFAESISIVISSCDAFFDCWRPFAFFFRKYWRDCPFSVYLIANELTVKSRFIRPINVGPDRGWASNLKTALQQIATPRFLYLQEDYFLQEPVRTGQLAADFEYSFAHDLDALCFRARTELETGFQPVNDRFGVVPPESDGRTRCQLTLWKRDSFFAALCDGETAWEMESRGSARTREMQVLSYTSRDDAPVRYLMSAIQRGLWVPEALARCRAENVAIPSFRGLYSSQSLLRRWRRAQTRNALRQQLTKRRGQTIDLDRDVALEH